MAEGLEEKYLLSEMLPEPEHAEEQVYFQLLKMASKSMLEQIGTVARERQEYREYIEQWIHEIKTPITAMKLLCENHKEPFTRELMRELEKNYTIVIVTHNMQQAARISDFTAFFYKGVIEEFDSTSKIFTNPSNKKTEDYVNGKFS